MSKLMPLPDIINGFKVVKDLGRSENGMRYAIVICKECNMEFQTSTYHVSTIKSCGCLPCRPPKSLPENINGFKIIKDFGYFNGSRRALIICKVCKCEYQADPNKLKYRKHCGCVSSRHGIKISKFTKKYPRLMQTYQHMKARCYNKNNKDYYNYGGRGIYICDEWLLNKDTFFEWALSTGYDDTKSIDRINNDKCYEPNNCRWADSIIQGRNTRRNVLTMEIVKEIRALKGKMTHKEISIKFGVSKGTIDAVIYNNIWKE